jgi:hypothetical protein
MADNIGGFKINGLCGWATIGFSGGGAPTPVAGTPSTEILIQQFRKVLIITVVFQVLKLSFVVANIR